MRMKELVLVKVATREAMTLSTGHGVNDGKSDLWCSKPQKNRSKDYK